MDVLAEERNHQLTDILTNLYALIAVSHARIAIINIFVNHFMLKFLSFYCELLDRLFTLLAKRMFLYKQFLFLLLSFHPMLLRLMISNLFYVTPIKLCIFESSKNASVGTKINHSNMNEFIFFQQHHSYILKNAFR